MDTTTSFTLPQVFRDTVNKYPDKVALRYTVAKPDPKGDKFTDKFQQIDFTWKQYEQEATRFAKSLIAVGVGPYKSVTIHGSNSPQSCFAAMGTSMANDSFVGIYPTNSDEATRHCVTNSRAEVVVVENEEKLKKYIGLNSSAVKCFVVWNKVNNSEAFKSLGQVYDWEQFLELGKDVSEEALKARAEGQTPEDLCTLIYTSGTTSMPKGVKLSHDNITWMSKTAGSKFGLTKDDEGISYLPTSHIAALEVDVVTPATFGYAMTIAPPGALKGNEFKQHLLQARPTFFLAVPDVWRKMRDGMVEKMNSATSTQKFLFNKITSISRHCLNDLQKLEEREYSKGQHLWNVADRVRGFFDRFALSLCNALLLNKIKAAIGLDRCVLAASGAAPISRDLVDFFLGLNLPIRNLYGASETSGICTFPHAGVPFGSVGPALDGTTVKLGKSDENGLKQILVKGRHITRGYHDNAQATQAAFDDEFFYKTGDAGEMDAHGNITITGRITEIYKTAGGEKVQPVDIEDNIKKELPIISQAVVIAEGKNFVTCLLSLKADEADPTKLASSVITALAKLGSSATTIEEAAKDSLVQKHIQEGIERANKQAVNNAQTVKKFTIVHEDFSEATGEVTPTRKLKRTVIAQKHATEINAMYAEKKN